MSFIQIINYSDCEQSSNGIQDDEFNNKTSYDNLQIVRLDNQIETISEKSKNQFFDDEIGVKETKPVQYDKPCSHLTNINTKEIQKKIRKSKKKNLIQTNKHDVPLQEVNPVGLEEISAFKDDDNQNICNSIIVKSLPKISKQSKLKKEKSVPKETKSIPKETKNIAKNFANSFKSYIKQIKDAKLKSTYCVRKFLKAPPKKLGLQQFRQYLKKNQLMGQLAEHFFGSCGWVRIFLENNKTDIGMYFRHLNIWKE